MTYTDNLTTSPAPSHWGNFFLYLFYISLFSLLFHDMIHQTLEQQMSATPVVVFSVITLSLFSMLFTIGYAPEGKKLIMAISASAVITAIWGTIICLTIGTFLIPALFIGGAVTLAIIFILALIDKKYIDDEYD